MNFLISLIMAENAYQQDQAAAASEAARRLGAQVQILYADNDATQSQQLLNVIQSSSADSRPDAIVCIAIHWLRREPQSRTRMDSLSRFLCTGSGRQVTRFISTFGK